MWWQFLIFGALGGVLGGMGMGGGTLLIPLLTLFTKTEQKEAQGINLLVFIPMAIIALIIHFKNKLVNIKTSIFLVLTGVVFSILGSFLALKLKSENLKIYYGIFLIVLSIFQIVSIFVLDKIKNKNKQKQKIKKY